VATKYTIACYARPWFASHEIPRASRRRHSEQQLAHGELKVILHGRKLHGAFVLLQPGKRVARAEKKARWLLIKRRDEYANPSWRIDDSVLDHSVISGRTMNEIKENQPAKEYASR
jgi:bifunctional non-homologous end joining protein LigD